MEIFAESSIKALFFYSAPIVLLVFLTLHFIPKHTHTVLKIVIATLFPAFVCLLTYIVVMNNVVSDSVRSALGFVVASLLFTLFFLQEDQKKPKK